MSGIAQRVATIETRIEEALRRAGRSRSSLTLVAVSKTRSLGEMAEVHAAGVRHFGENRVQEAESKVSQGLLPESVLHLVGHLQSNKAKQAVRLFQVIHSVDSPELLRELESRATGALDLLVQVDLAGEASKHGVAPQHLPDLLQSARSLKQVRITGLMCIPPRAAHAEESRPWFRRLRELRDQQDGSYGLSQLSMGMSQDFEVAIEEGATLIRVGEAIFGPRQRL